MPIPVVCPSCARKLRAPGDWAGRKTKCAKCGSEIVVPTPEDIVEVHFDLELPLPPVRRAETPAVRPDSPMVFTNAGGEASDSLIRFICPMCWKRLKAPAKTAGRRARCTSCGQALVVPRTEVVSDQENTPSVEHIQVPPPLPFDFGVPSKGEVSDYSPSPDS